MPAPTIADGSLASLIEGYANLGLDLKDSVSGDLNKDSLPDRILLFSPRNSGAIPTLDTVAPRPLVILVGAGRGGFRQASVNWNAVLCGTCGNRLSDPFEKIVIKDGYFSLEHAASDSGMGWKRILTFKYADSSDTWILNRDGMISWIAAAEGERPIEYHVARTRKDFGAIPIDSFNIYALDDRDKALDSSKVFPVNFGHTPSYMGWHRVRGGLWNILDYCTGNLSEGYMFFAKQHGNAYESESESEMSVAYHLVKNAVADDTCKGIAFKGIAPIKAGKVRHAVYDSAARLYHLGRDTIRFSRGKELSDPNSDFFVITRGQDTLVRSSGYAGQGVSSIEYAGDINADGFLDFVEEYTDNSQSTTLILSSKGPDGRIGMEAVGTFTATE